MNGIQEQIVNLQKKIEKIESLDYLKEQEKIRKLSADIEVNQRKSFEIVEGMGNTKQSIEILAGQMAESKNTEKYTKFAEDNRKSARWLFWTSISIMGIVGIISLILFIMIWGLDLSEDEIKIILWLRFPMLLVILMPAFFMMRESKKLKDKEFQYHDMACRIITSAPYIDGLSISDEEKGKLKADLVKDFFARPIECIEDGGLTPMSEVAKAIKNCTDLKK